MVDTIKLLAPLNCAPITRDGVTYTPDGANTVEVPGDLLDDLQQHGFVLYAPPANSADDPNSAPDEEIDTMSRNELFAFLKAKGIAVTLPVTNDKLRDMARDANKSAAPVQPVQETQEVPAATSAPADTSSAPQSDPAPQAVASTAEPAAPAAQQQ